MIASRRGFTLLELLLVVVLIATLIGLALPSMTGSRAAARMVTTQARLRQCGQLLTIYASDWKDAHPCVFDPAGTSAVVRLSGGRNVEIHWYFMQTFYWHLALVDGYLDGHIEPAVLQPSEPPPYLPQLFAMTCTAFTAPEFWDLATRTGERQYRATRTHDVTFPASKAILISISNFENDADTGQPYFPGGKSPDPLVPLLMSDGSVRVPAKSAIRPGVPSGEGPTRGSLHGADFYAAHHTINGLRGRDIE